ncbi:hypothetical protein BABINDRAFT_158871 [Babjeviella inositovora NRRL Y-12698]|uniref:Uncharacterized protein n=1 Tax=Babjeviella inositovora NRRL Y-12698 TaxID=984486 RepID=A0A1E3QXG5_9ASCO|nr:uncharacterized protein BABINDRAFT_158871 [Babjeviella inositovora NRRL Y-12698]ODQ82234.1 hypothetical protein BABINDRAFT_158871 [Babjeviella inositovora NRRL Y-12698]
MIRHCRLNPAKCLTILLAVGLVNAINEKGVGSEYTTSKRKFKTTGQLPLTTYFLPVEPTWIWVTEIAANGAPMAVIPKMFTQSYREPYKIARAVETGSIGLGSHSYHGIVGEIREYSTVFGVEL